MKINQTLKKLSKISKLSKPTSKKINEIKKLKLKFEKTICFEAKSIKKSKKLSTKNSCCANSLIFWSSASTINCCLFSTKSICLNNRCCFAKVSRSSAFSFFRLFSKQRQRIVFNETKSHKTITQIHSVHLFENLSTRQALKVREQLRHKRIITTSKLTNFSKIARRKKKENFLDWNINFRNENVEERKLCYDSRNKYNVYTLVKKVKHVWTLINKRKRVRVKNTSKCSECSKT